MCKASGAVRMVLYRSLNYWNFHAGLQGLLLKCIYLFRKRVLHQPLPYLKRITIWLFAPHKFIPAGVKQGK